MTLRRDCPGSGPRTAEVLILGEAPGADEVEKKIPFVGMSGRLLRRALTKNGFREADLRFENVVERRPPSNDIADLYEDTDRIIPSPELLEWWSDLKLRIQALPNLRLILTFGETALQAVTGLVKQRKKSLLSIYHCTPVPGPVGPGGGKTWVVPAYHPAYILRSFEALPWFHLAMKKGQRILGGAVDADRRVSIATTIDSALEFLGTLPTAPLVSCDIEILSGELACIAFATGTRASGYKATSIPISAAGGSVFSPSEEASLWSGLARALRDTPELLFQNFIFDTMWLSRYGLSCGGRIHDTMLAAGLLHPELTKKLGDLARIYTLAPAWKKDFDWGSITDPAELHTYNALDAALTLEIYEGQMDAIEKRGLASFYRRHVLELIPRVYLVCERGWRVDEAALSAVREETERQTATLKHTLQETATEFGLTEFNPNSVPQVKELLSRMGVSIPIKDGRETTGKTALLKLTKRPGTDVAFLRNLLLYKKASKLRSTYGNVQLDSDGRLRFSINIAGTVSGRFSSSQTPWDTGLNSQNVPSRDPTDPFNFRHIVIPDPGHVFVQVDLAQAEARVVAWLSGDEGLDRIFSEGGDVHTRTASLIFNEDIRGLPDDERGRKRYLGKKCVHAFNYGMAEGTFADTCLTEAGLSIPLPEAKRLREAYFRAFPSVPVWHRSIQDELRRTRRLVTPYGRSRAFHDRLTDDLFREAYSFIPQGTVADTLNESWIRLTERMRGICILQQGHDSLLIQAEKHEAGLIVRLIREVFASVSFLIRGRERSIPFDIAVGHNWRDMKKV